jgi:cold shock CspA family protein
MPTTLVRNKHIRKGYCFITAEDGQFIYSGPLREGFKRLEDNESEMQLSPEDFDRIAAEEVLKRMN